MQNPSKLTVDMARLLQGFTKIPAEQPQDFVYFVAEYMAANDTEKLTLADDYTHKIRLGPLGETCGCCGK